MGKAEKLCRDEPGLVLKHEDEFNESENWPNVPENYLFQATI